MTADYGMEIDRDEHQQQYVTLGNAVARDTRLTFRASGLLTDLLSRPPGSRVTTATLATGCREGVGAIRTAMNELIGVGYVKRTKSRDDLGHWITRLKVYETPQPVDEADMPKLKQRRARVPVPPKTKNPKVDSWSPAPPAETPVSAGHAGDQKPDAGFLVPKDLKNEDLKNEKKDEDRSARTREPLLGVVVGSSDPMTDMILFEVEERTQTKITPEFAERVAMQILGRAPSKPRDPVKYVRAAIRREEDPRNFLPTGVPDMWDRAMTRAGSHEQQMIADLERKRSVAGYLSAEDSAWLATLKRSTGKHTPYQDPADPSVYDLGFDGKPRRPSATDRACDEAQALKGQMVARMPGETRTAACVREHLEDPVDLNAQMAAMFGGSHPRGGASDPLTDQVYGPGSTRI
jgi:hypothetical protein